MKIVDKEELIQERERKIADRIAKEEAKKQRLAAELKKKSTPANEYFREMSDKYSNYDEMCIPTHDNTGKELSKEIKNKLKKEFIRQDKLHKKWVADEEKKRKVENESEISNKTEEEVKE